MKNSGSVAKMLTVGSVAMAIVLVAGFTSTTAAQEKGAAKLFQSKPHQTPSSETTAMSCPKCKDRQVMTVERPTKTGAKAETRTVLRHECPGCWSTLTTEGHGKAKTTSVTHTCNLAGNKNPSCCGTIKARKA